MARPRVARSPASGIHGSRTGTAAVMAAVIIWGFTNTFIKLSHLPALTFTVYRLWLGAALLLAVLVVTRRGIAWEHVRAAALAGVLFGAQIAFLFGALKHTSLVDATMISALQPAIVLLVAGRMFGEQATTRDIGSVFASLVGVALVMLGTSGTPAWSLGGDLMAVAALVGFTAYFLVSKRARDSIPPLQYMTIVFLVAALMITPIAVIAGSPLGGVRSVDWLILGVFVAGATAAHVLLVWAHASVDVSLSSTLLLAQPVLTAVSALVILGEPIPPLAILGGTVVLGSLGLIVRRAAPSHRLPPDAELE